MANIIDQLEISGITYDIVDASAQAALSGKQDTLVSGVNIKTINSESLLGSGNIEIQGGTGDAYTKAETDALLAAKADTSTVTSAVTEFSAALGNEIQRAQGVEQVLSGAIDTKVDSSDVYLKSETSSSTEINNALELKANASTTYTKAETDNAINAATSGKADTSAVTSAVSEFTTALSNEIQRAMAAEQTISGAVDTKANSSDVYLKSETSSSTEINNALQAKADASTTYSKTETDNAINAATSGKADTSAVTADINAAVSGKADTSAVTSAVTEFTAALGNEIQRAQGVEQVLSGAIDGKQATLVSGTNIKTINNQSLLGSGNIDIQGGGGANVVELTQAEYDALATKDPDTFYIITDATPIDTRMFYTTAQTSSSTEIATALSEKQNVLTAGSGIDISNDVISVTGGGGGGKAVSAGTNISITTGDTADTINCTLPITISNSDNGTKQSIAIGDGSSAHISNWYDSIAIGKNSKGYFGSVVIGSNPTAYTQNNGSNVAIGDRTKFYDNSVVIGAYAEGYNGWHANSVVIGNSARAKNIEGAVAIGYDVSTSGTTKTNINNQIKVDTDNQVYIKDSSNTNEICIQDKFDEIDTTIGDINTILSSL